eukprot:TRINITY_DN32199_c0_g1_i1.p1 TRINITY_DN32199_c0_g1~~TRINITY_DN32199_c0_g1_i1.p1  ORF type:complete len:279 (+),score=69.83 TRINITY_DN32199_c0_g1_i1:68-838(+)
MHPLVNSFDSSMISLSSEDPYPPAVSLLSHCFPTEESLEEWKDAVRKDLQGRERYPVFDQRDEKRNDFITVWGWTRLEDDIAEDMTHYGPLVELFAGSGVWAEYLRENFNSDVVAIDSKDEEKQYSPVWRLLPCNDRVIEEDCTGSESMASRWGTRNLLMIWPPQDDSAFKALSFFKGQILLYVGEGRHGSNADSNFFDLIDEEWIVEKAIPVQKRFSGKYDHYFVFHRRKDNEPKQTFQFEVSEAQQAADSCTIS